MTLPAEGMSAREVACECGLPVERIEGVFVNHVVRGLDHVVMPGDRIAFVPPGTPGPHRFLLGLYGASAAPPSETRAAAAHAPDTSSSTRTRTR